MINTLRCAIAGAIAAYGAVQTQNDDKVGVYLLAGGIVIVVLSLLEDYFPEGE